MNVVWYQSYIQSINHNMCVWVVMFGTCLLTCTQQFIYDTLISKHDGFPIILSSQTYIQPWKISFQWFDSLSSFDLCTYKEIFVNRVLSFTLVGWLWKLYQIGSHEFIDLVLIQKAFYNHLACWIERRFKLYAHFHVWDKYDNFWISLILILLMKKAWYFRRA